MSPIPIMPAAHCDPHFERSSINFKESKLDGVTFSSGSLNYGFRKSKQLECEDFYGFLQTEEGCGGGGGDLPKHVHITCRHVSIKYTTTDNHNKNCCTRLRLLALYGSLTMAVTLVCRVKM